MLSLELRTVRPSCYHVTLCCAPAPLVVLTTLQTRCNQLLGQPNPLWDMCWTDRLTRDSVNVKALGHGLLVLRASRP